MQLSDEQAAADQGTATEAISDVKNEASCRPHSCELASAVPAAVNDEALTSVVLTPLPRARSLVVLSDTGPSRPDLATGTLNGLSVAPADVAEAPSPSVTGPLHSRPRREFDKLSKADEVVLFPKKFRYGMLWQDVWGLPLPFLAFTLALREDVDVTCPEVRDAIARVNCVEGGSCAKSAQARLTPTVSAFGPKKPKPKSKRKGGRRGPEREPDWSTTNPFVWSLLLEEAANRYAAGTFTPSDEA